MISAHLPYLQRNHELTNLSLDDFEFAITPMMISSIFILPIKTSKFLPCPGVTAISTSFRLRVALGNQSPKVFVLVSSSFKILDELRDLAGDYSSLGKAGLVKLLTFGKRDIGKYLSSQLDQRLNVAWERTMV
jgi:hypothetical protein